MKRLALPPAADPQSDEQPKAKKPRKKYPSVFTDSQKHELAALAETYGDFFAYCLKIAEEKTGETLKTEESIRAVATTIFIQSLRG